MGKKPFRQQTPLPELQRQALAVLLAYPSSRKAAAAREVKALVCFPCLFSPAPAILPVSFQNVLAWHLSEGKADLLGTEGSNVGFVCDDNSVNAFVSRDKNHSGVPRHGETPSEIPPSRSAPHPRNLGGLQEHNAALHPVPELQHPGMGTTASPLQRRTALVSFFNTLGCQMSPPKPGLEAEESGALCPRLPVGCSVGVSSAPWYCALSSGWAACFSDTTGCRLFLLVLGCDAACFAERVPLSIALS